MVNKAPPTRPKSPAISPDLQTVQPRIGIARPETQHVKQLLSPQNSKPLTYLRQ